MTHFKRIGPGTLSGCVTAAVSAAAVGQAIEFRRISVEDYRDKMAAGWIGQMVGVGWGGPTEFRSQGEIMPESILPDWTPEMVNQHEQDDLYVEMTFLRTLDEHGFDVSHDQAGLDFARTQFPLWHANAAARENLRNGIAPPDSGHPEFNAHADDIDYQIEADYSGLIAPGLPNVAIELGEKFGRIMNYGDGLYGGQFIGGMYTEAFFESDIEKVIEAGLRCIPEESQYAEAVRDVLAWYREEPDDWEATWRRVNEKYHLNPEYRRSSCTGSDGRFNIDAKLNGAYVVMGLLYGKGDPDRTIIIATRCGQDSDCNPSNAGGVLMATMGAKALPERYVSALNREALFSHTSYSFNDVLDVCERLARQAVKRGGGRIERDDEGREWFVIPITAPQPTRAERSWTPGPKSGGRYGEDEAPRKPVSPSQEPE